MEKFKFIIIALLIYSGAAIAQEKTINLWPDGVPGSISNPDYAAEIDSDETWTWEKKVSNPTIDVYPAPAEIANGTAVLICPGGGYSVLAVKHEGSQVAEWLNKLGITGIVLKYRLPDNSIMKNKTIGPLQDAQKAMRIIRRQAKKWNINPNKIGVMGFSAGGHLASTLSTHYNDKVYSPIDLISSRPDFSILIYPVISMDSSITHKGSRINLLGKHPTSALIKKYSNELQVNKSTPPAFLAASMDDNTVPVQNSINYALALKKYNIPCELHIYEKGGHGYGMGRTNDTESSWPEACKKWLKARGFLK
jgi:acetyl esterase/lipase